MDQEAIWALYFAGITSMQYHPGAGRGDHEKMDPYACAIVADVMLFQHNRRWPKCPGSSVDLE